MGCFISILGLSVMLTAKCRATDNLSDTAPNRSYSSLTEPQNHSRDR